VPLSEFYEYTALIQPPVLDRAGQIRDFADETATQFLELTSGNTSELGLFRLVQVPGSHELRFPTRRDLRKPSWMRGGIDVLIVPCSD
jgi:hypothetical protein